MSTNGIFTKAKVSGIPRSTFDLSHDHKLSLNMGKLVPVHIQEALPGDKFTMTSEAMFRMQPMIAPIMQRIDIYMHHFFVPNRILWNNWETFITGGEDGTQTPALPLIAEPANPINSTPSSLANYLGLPQTNIDTNISALPFAAYQRIFYDYYRDQNNDATTQKIDLVDGLQDAPTLINLQQLQDRAWEHDYFTSALPFEQRGPDVQLPFVIEEDAAVETYPYNDANFGGATISRNVTDGAPSVAGDLGIDITGNIENTTTGIDQYIDPHGNLFADTEGLGTSGTINDLRTAYALQKWLERNARGGARYTEQLFAHFRIRSQDARLQRPEYIGGSYANMTISEVLQTSQTDTTAQGNMSGHGIGVTSGKRCSYSCKEHGYMITILSIRPRTSYYQGIPKHFFKTNKLDYYFPSFAHLGEQAIKNKELFFQTSQVSYNEGDFGYIPRYTEYRYLASRVSGDMASTLQYWHLGREFNPLAPPVLNEDFIRCVPSLRIFAVVDPDVDHIIAHVYHKIFASRPLPRYGNPGNM